MLTVDPALADALRDRYVLEHEIGRGGMATVFAARDLRHARQVAVKVLHPHLASALGPERFLREIATVAALRHPHIMPLYDSGQAGDSLYQVMPLIEGESLSERIAREGQLPVDDAIRIASEVADALSYAHRHGIVHRDVKPANILLESGHAVVADFGIARAIAAAGGDRLTETGLAIGTPTYMSPEQAAGSRDVDGRTDIYALGCVLYEMLTGAPPFTGPNPQALLARHSLDAVPGLRIVRSAVPESVERVILRALGKAPADRYATARDFADALAAAAASPQATTPARRLPPRSVVLAVSLAILGVVAVIGAAAWWMVGRADGVPGGGSAADAPARRVAVLSFANLSADTADAYLARGISEEIASRLGDFAVLEVASRSSVERLERPGAGELLDRARSLGFGHLVEGSVRRVGEQLRVTVQLVQVDAGVGRWGDSYDGAASDLLALQDEIAIDVAQAVAGRLAPADTVRRAAPAPSPAAYDQLLRGNYYIAQRNPRGLARGVEAYAEATRLDPEFAPGFARLAHAYLLLLDWGWTYQGLPSESLFTRGWAAAERAVALDSTLAEAWLASGSLLRFDDRGGFTGVRQALERAVELEPENAEAHHELGMTLRLLDDDAAAAAQFRQALAIEPDRPMTLVHLGWIDMVRRRYAESARWLDSAAAVNPGFYQAYMERAQLRLAAGDTAGARSDAETTVRLRPPDDPLAAEDVLLTLDLMSGDTAAARARLRRHRPAAPDPSEPGVHQATAWAALLVAAGEHAAALDFLERAQVAPAHLRMHLEEPKFDPLRRDPRFQAFMEASRLREAD